MTDEPGLDDARHPGGTPPSLLDLGIELPDRGTGARAARRAAQAAAAQRESVEPDVARRLPALGRVRRARSERAARDPGEEVEPRSWDDGTDGRVGRRGKVGERAPLGVETTQGAPSEAADGQGAPSDAAERDPTTIGEQGHAAPPVGGPTPAAPSRQLSRRWMAGFAAALVACVLVASGLIALGISTLRESRTGRTVVSAQPDEPGFEGFLEPTPTLAVRVVDEGELLAAYVLSLGVGDLGGGVLLIPAETLVGSGDFGSLALAHAFGGTDDSVRGAIEIVAGAGLDEMVTIDHARWAELVAPVAPIQLDNPDDVEGFPAGPLTLGPDEVGPYLAARDEGESALAALVRHEVFWEAWLDQLAGAGEGAVPGELDTGLGRFVRGLAAGPHQVRELPVVETRREDGGSDLTVDEEARSDLIVTLIPYPRGTANAPRTLVRLLDGTGDGGHVARVAPQVVASDSSIVVVGNADRFDYETTQIRYHRPDQRAAAERLREDLGVGEVIEDVRPIDSFDVTIVLGTDL